MKKISNDIKGIACGYMTAILFGGTTTVASLVMRSNINKTSLLFLRAVICTCALFLITRARGRKGPVPWKMYRRTFLLGALVYAAQSAVYFAVYVVIGSYINRRAGQHPRQRIKSQALNQHRPQHRESGPESDKLRAESNPAPCESKSGKTESSSVSPA